MIKRCEAMGILRGMGRYFLGIGRHGDHVRERAMMGEFVTDPRELRRAKTDSYMFEALDFGIARIGCTASDAACIVGAVVYDNPMMLLGVAATEVCRAAASLVVDHASEAYLRGIARRYTDMQRLSDRYSGRTRRGL